MSVGGWIDRWGKEGSRVDGLWWWSVARPDAERSYAGRQPCWWAGRADSLLNTTGFFSVQVYRAL